MHKPDCSVLDNQATVHMWDSKSHMTFPINGHQSIAQLLLSIPHLAHVEF
jgi:hypothetical protein